MKRNIFALYHQTNHIGSAICLLNGNNYYILTAKHCIENYKKNLYSNEQGIKIEEDIDFGDYENIPLIELCVVQYYNATKNDYSFRLEDKLLISEDKDIAIFVVSKLHFSICDIEEKLGIITQNILEPKAFEEGIVEVIGFPASLQNNPLFKGRPEKYSCTDLQTHIESSFFCTSERNRDYSQIQGVSGGGVFWNNHLYGIETNFYENTFRGISLLEVNLLLEKNGYNVIKTNYIPTTKTGITTQKLQQIFGTAKNGWLKERYTPEIVNTGKIEESAKEILFHPSYIKKIILEIDYWLDKLKNIEALLDKFDQLTNNKLKHFLQGFKNHLLEMQEHFLMVKRSLNNNHHPIKINHQDKEIIRKKLFTIFNKIKKIRLADSRWFYQLQSIRDSAESFLNADHYQVLEDIINKNQPHNLIVLGLPGTGKTHGVSKVIDCLLGINHPAVIISAQTSPCNSWKDILNFGLELPDKFTLDEILNDLKSLATAAKINKQTLYKPYPLIVIDGIDEADKNKTKYWLDRINELQEYIKDYPNIRFIITSRRYESNENPYEFSFNETNHLLRLNRDGDVPLLELIPQYLAAYDIKTPFNLEPAIKDALSLKLFCQQYKGSDLSLIGTPARTTLQSLISHKISSMWFEFREKNNPVWHKNDDKKIFTDSLWIIAQSLQTSGGKNSRKELSLAIEMKISQDNNWSRKILDQFADHGFLFSYEVEIEDFLPYSEWFYQVTYQSYMDYIFADKTTEEIVKTKDKNAPNKDSGILLLVAISLLTDHGIWIGEDGYWQNLKAQVLLSNQVYLLSFVSDEIVKSKLEKIEILFKANIQNRNIIIEDFIIPNLYRKNLDLENFIHEILLSFPNTFERDLFWARPEYGNNSKFEKSIVTIMIQNKDECPLLCAWCLACLDNLGREHLCKRLTIWGAKNIEKFTQLLNTIFFKCNDPQIQEDLSIVALGIATQTKSSSTEFKGFADWILVNIFDGKKIVTIHNSVIRYCMRAVIERAFMFKLCSEEKVALASPPYKTNKAKIPLDIKGLNDSDDLIYGDLAWYVIGYSYKDFLNLDDSNSLSFLRKYSKIDNPMPFALAATLAFAKNLGWYKRKDATHLNTQKSHGSKSELATLEEKYVWLAVHEIQGYLADRLPYNKKEKVADYGIFLNIPHLVEDFEIKDTHEYYNDWYLPENFSPRLRNKTQEAIKDWIKDDSYDTNQSLWINIQAQIGSCSEWISLYTFTKLIDSTDTVGCTIQSICCLIDETKFNEFIADFKTRHVNMKWQFNSIDSFKARPNTGTYNSVRDIIWMNWMDEEDNTTTVGDIDILATVTRVTEHSISENEQFFLIPSKMMRNALGITDTNKKWFKDNAGNLKAFYHETKSYNQYDSNQQEFLAIPKDDFYTITTKMKMQPFWVFWEFRRTTLATESPKGMNYHLQNCKMWLVWEENGIFETFKYIDARYTNS